MSGSPCDILSPSEVRGRHLRAARVLLDWTKARAARECNVGVNSIGRFEDDWETLTPRTVEDIVRRFESAGVVFVRCELGTGVLLRLTEDIDA